MEGEPMQGKLLEKMRAMYESACRNAALYIICWLWCLSTESIKQPILQHPGAKLASGM